MKAFLCHSSVDKPYVSRVAKKLTRARVNYAEMCFEPLIDFRDSIASALSASSIFIFFASKSSLESTWARYEIDQAHQLLRRGLLKTAAAIIIDEHTRVADLPPWMQETLVERVLKPSRSVRIIAEHLNRLREIRVEPLFIGRERLMADFAQRVIETADEASVRVFIISGLPGIGRQTFLKHALRNTLSLSTGARFVLERTDGFDVLHAQLLDEVGELDSREALSRATRASSGRTLKKEWTN